MSSVAASWSGPRAPVASTAVAQLRQLTLLALWAFAFTLPSSSGLLMTASVGTISRLVGGLAVALAIGAMLVGGRWHRLLETHVVMILIAGWMYVSMLWSIAPALTTVARWTAVQLAVLSLIVWEFARERHEWRSLMWAYVIGAIGGAAGIVQAVLSGASYGVGRFSAAGFNPGTQAYVLLLSLPLAAYLAWSSPSRAARAVAWLYLPLGVTAVLLTAARASLLILPVALAGVPLGQRARGLHRGVRGSRSVPLVMAMLVALALVFTLLPAETTARLGTLSSELSEGDLSGRAGLWEVSAESIGEHELIGVGAGASRRVLRDAVGALKGTHNAYLAVVTELGVIGLVLLLLLLISAGQRALRHAPPERVLALTTLAVVALGMMPNHVLSEKSTWLALSFVLAPTPDRTTRRTRRGRLALGAGSRPATGAPS